MVEFQKYKVIFFVMFKVNVVGFLYSFDVKFAVLIEKILRTMPDVGKIYVLIKAKNMEAAMARLKSEVCFFTFMLISRFI